MGKFDDGSATRMAEERIFMWETSDLLDKDLKKSFQEYLFSFKKADSFYEHAKKHAEVIGYNGDNREELVNFIHARCQKSEIYFSQPDEENKKTIRRWICKGDLPWGDKGRENVYKLCFVLQMDEESTAEFFLKGFWERPFNFKDIHEATYFFCMKNGLEYADACRIISAVEASNDDVSEQEESTGSVGKEIEKFGSEEELIRYLSMNHWTEKQTAIQKIRSLAEECKKLASEECKSQGKEFAMNSFESLLYVILGYRARQQEDKQKVYPKSIRFSDLPKSITSNFPTRATFQAITNGTANHDAIRKMLVLLHFYQFFASARIEEHGTPDELFDEYIDELDVLLEECGYMQHYWRNPYDWMFGHCAFQEEPLEALREIIEVFYLDKEEE